MSLNERISVAGDDELELTPDEVRHVLNERARKLSQAYAETADSTEENLQLITFSRGSHRYAVDLQVLTEIRPLATWTRVPGIPDYFEGVIQVRGEIIALVDIVTLFEGMRSETDNDPTLECFAVVVSTAAATMALLADSVDDVHDVRPERVHPPLATFRDSRGRYIKAIVEDGPAIIDVEKLLGDERLWVLHETNE
jgi:purine-binding chemotaxis protein CheW